MVLCRSDRAHTSCVCSGHVMKWALTTMLLVCSSAASCMRLVSWLRYRWFSCRRRGAASLDTHRDTVTSRHPVEFGTEWLCAGTDGALTCRLVRGAMWGGVGNWLAALTGTTGTPAAGWTTRDWRLSSSLTSSEPEESREKKRWGGETDSIESGKYSHSMIQKCKCGVLLFIMHLIYWERAGAKF